MLTQTKYSSKFYPDAIIDVKKEGNFFIFTTSETILEARVMTDKIIRFRYAADGFFQKDFSYAVSKYFDEKLVELHFYEDDGFYYIQTQSITAKISKENMKITMLDRQNNIISEDEAGFHWQHYLVKGGKINYCSKKIQPDEYFYGMGDKPTEMNLRGKYFENYGMDTYGFQKDQDPLYKNIPFFMGVHSKGEIGYGIFYDNSFRTIFDFGKGNPDILSFYARGGEIELLLYLWPRFIKSSRTICQFNRNARTASCLEFRLPSM